MEKKNWLTKTMAIEGTILVMFPLFAPIIFSILQVISTGNFLFDYLMPAELGLPVLAGAVILLWASIRSRKQIKWIAWCFGIAIFLIFGGQGLAVITGLASGKIEANGWQYGVVIGSIIGYDIAVIGLVVGGVLLCTHLIHRSNELPLIKA